MYRLYRAGKTEEAIDIHYGLHPLVDLLFVETNPAPAKWVLEHRGLIRSAHVRPPLIGPTEPGLLRIRQLLSQGERYLSPTDGFILGGD
jgi:4-hydroxy-tetrahydrodipicolinate synthase